MGSIPLPALDVRPPSPQPNVLDQFAKLQALQQMSQQNQFQQQQRPLQLQSEQQGLQTGAVELQQKQQQQKNQQAVTQAMTDWDGQDINQLYPLILKHGGDGQTVLGLKKAALDQQAQIATAAKNNAQATEAQVNATLKKNDLINGALSPLADPKQTPDAQLVPSLTQTVQSLQEQGALDPQHAQAAMQLAQSGDPNAIRQGITQFTNTLRAHSQITEEGLKQAQTSLANADAANARGKIDPTSPLYAPSADAVALGTAPGAAQIQQNEVAMAGRKAGAEEGARLGGEMALARQRQALSHGGRSDQ